MKSFEDPIVAVVIGSNRGIGLAFVQQLLMSSMVDTVYAGCRNLGSARDLDDAVKTYGARVVPIAVDVTSSESIEDLANRLEFDGAQPNLVVNCAGLLLDRELQPEKRLEDVTLDGLRRSFDVNSIGPVLLMKALKQLIPNQQRVVIANLSARVGSLSDNKLGGWYGYRASKAAQNMFTRNIAIELGRRNKKLVCVGLHPGTVDTDLSRPFQRSVPAQSLLSADTSAKRLLDVIDSLSPEESGGFYAYDGSRIPW